LLLDGRWNELLEACETVMTRPESRGWLDLQRYAVTACDNLGGEFETVGRAIRAELALLLRELPSLPDLSLMDDTGTANTETRQWLRDEQLLPRTDDGEVVQDAESAATPRTPIRRMQSDAVYERAREAARSGQVKRAIELLSAEVERERSTRGRFMRRAQIATLMLDGGLDAPAQPILEELIGQIDAHNLEQWEAGEMVAQPLTLLFQCLTKLDLDADRRQEIYLRVARLDPLQAMNLAG
jgi:type VI secretion system protein ImpA